MARSADAWVVVVREVDGQRYARRFPLGVDRAFAANGVEGLPQMSDRAISDFLNDLQHEQHRRAGTLAQLGGWTPSKPSREFSRHSEREDGV